MFFTKLSNFLCRNFEISYFFQFFFLTKMKFIRKTRFILKMRLFLIFFLFFHYVFPSHEDFLHKPPAESVFSLQVVDKYDISRNPSRFLKHTFMINKQMIYYFEPEVIFANFLIIFANFLIIFAKSSIKSHETPKKPEFSLRNPIFPKKNLKEIAGSMALSSLLTPIDSPSSGECCLAISSLKKVRK